MISCYFEDDTNKAYLRHAVVDALVFKDGQVLMVKRTAKLLEGGKWGLVGGYVELDENLAQAAEREIMEETGWQVRDIKLLSITDKPDRPNDDRQNIVFVYFCHAVEKTGEPDWESDEQRWYDINNLPPLDQIAFDHNDHIKVYQRYLKEQFTLPYVG